MRPFTLCAALLMIAVSHPAQAQVRSDPAQLNMKPPIIDPPSPDGSRCFTLVNTAPYTVAGTVRTNFFETATGNMARANRNFRLRSGAQQEICTYGPFYPGERVELVLRTLVPLFSCYTVAQGTILIQGKIKPEGGTQTWADCQ